jgi:hypothetical protein
MYLRPPARLLCILLLTIGAASLAIGILAKDTETRVGTIIAAVFWGLLGSPYLFYRFSEASKTA